MLEHLSKTQRTPFNNESLLRKIVNESTSAVQVIKYFFPQYHGRGSGHYKTLARYIDKFGISTDHFNTDRKTIGLLLSSEENKIPLEDILGGKHPYYRTGNLKRRLLKENYLKNTCSLCPQIPVWNGKPLTMHLDHINGNPYDHNLTNLRIVCPNCHSQTPTYSRKAPKEKKPKAIRKIKIDWPSDDILRELVWSKSILKLSQDLGVSWAAVKDRCKRQFIELPPQGYWNKVGTGSHI